MTDWISQLGVLAVKGEPSVLLTVARVRGSAPREIGAKMIVTATESVGTIGGGQLEYQCIQAACEQLSNTAAARANSVRRFALGSGCGQCCGGVVDILFEFIPESGCNWLTELLKAHRERQPAVIATAMNSGTRKVIITRDGAGDECPVDVISAAQSILSMKGAAVTSSGFLLEPVVPAGFHIAIFGAGHVGAATVDALSRLDCNIRWIDGRRNIFPAAVPSNVTVIESAAPAREVAAMPEGAYFVVMTHSHPLDLEICDQVLRRDDAAYCGLIGSVAKRRRFERLMMKQGLSESLLENLVCPIGVSGIDGKKPVEIALAVAAEILQTRDRIAAVESRPVALRLHG